MCKYVCSVCGSDDIEVKAWVKANAEDDEGGYIIEWCEDDIPDCWCNDCREMTTFRSKDD